MGRILLVGVLSILAATPYLYAAPTGLDSPIGRGKDGDETAIIETSAIVENLVATSFPELRGEKIAVKTFQSQSDYFQSRFDLFRFASFRGRKYVIYVNPELYKRGAPSDAIRAIIAHELAHIRYYKLRNRAQLLGLVRLSSRSFTVRFERDADLQAIKRGYGPGLEHYREWLYRNIPAARIGEKKRNYLSPEEIEAVMKAVAVKPGLIDYWEKTVPLNLAEIKAAAER